ncbi:MAG: chorismate lyase, partial [Pseudomonadales bacterium]|nr:chorismate lyase [Pseudomonadales bacterium]
LGLHYGEWALLREVRLCVHGIAWIEARSVIPRRALATWARPLYRLGSQPLGALLFRMPHIKRHGLLVRQDPRGHWSRFSLFGPPDGPPIRVQETYLPALEHFLSARRTSA